MKQQLTYQDTCFIVNAMEFYLGSLKNNTNLSKESLEYYKEIIQTFEKLENQILQLKVEEEEKVNLKDYIYDVISYYDEEYSKEMGIDKLDDEDVNNIIFEILQDNQLRQIVENEIEMYSSFKLRRE